MTERDAGSETPRIATTAQRTDDGWVIDGHKAWTSRALHSDLMLLLARTAPYDPAHRADGLSTFLVDLHDQPDHDPRRGDGQPRHVRSPP